MSNNLVGSNFGNFLDEEGILAKTDIVALKRVIAFQVEQMMKEQNLSKTEMSRRMNTSRATLNHLPDPKNKRSCYRPLSVQRMLKENGCRFTSLDNISKEQGQ